MSPTSWPAFHLPGDRGHTVNGIVVENADGTGTFTSYDGEVIQPMTPLALGAFKHDGQSATARVVMLKPGELVR